MAVANYNGDDDDDDGDGNVTEGGSFGPGGKQARKCYAIKSLNLWDIILNTNLILPFYIAAAAAAADNTF